MHVQISNIENLSVDDLANGTVPFRKCYVERTEVTVDPYGNIVACPFVNNYVLGNIFQGDFQGIWRGASHRQFQRYQNGKKIGICTRCILSVQRSHDFNERLRRILGRRFVDNLLRMANH
jgi:radical SAM protein with 4Fe4S-binding SPASM domain